MTMVNLLPRDTLSEDECKQLIQSRLRTAAKTKDGKRFTLWMEVDPVLARGMLARLMYARQRTLNHERLAILIDAIETNTLLNNNEIWMCETPDGRYHIINAQHTLQAIVQSGRTVELQVVIDPCENVAEVGAHYACFDLIGVRSQVDINRAVNLADDFPEDTKLPVPIRHGVNAMSPIIFNLGDEKFVNKLERTELFRHEWKQDFTLLNTLLAPLMKPVSAKENESASIIESHQKLMLQHGFRQAHCLAVFMLALRTHQDETAKLVNAVVDRCKTNVPYTNKTVETLYQFLMENKTDQSSHHRAAISFANYVKLIVAHRNGAAEATLRDLVKDYHELSVADRAGLFGDLTEGKQPRYVMRRVKVDKSNIVKLPVK